MVSDDSTKLATQQSIKAYVDNQAAAGDFIDSTFSIFDNGDSTKILTFETSGITADSTTTLSVPDYDGTIATLAGTETLTNKTLTAPTIDTLVLNAAVSGTAVLDEDDMASDDSTKLATQQSIKAYVDDQAAAGDFIDSTFSIFDNGDSTKILTFETSGITADSTTILSVPDYDGTIATLAGTETLTNKTLTAPTIDTLTLNAAVSGTAVLDEDDMASDDATKLATQQSIKAYVDSTITKVGSMTSGDAFAGATADDDWLGLGAAAGRIAFNDTTTDAISFLNANVGIGTSAPGRRLEVYDGDISIKRSDQANPSHILFKNSGGWFNWRITNESGDGTDDFVIAGGNTGANPSDLTERIRITSDGRFDFDGGNVRTQSYIDTPSNTNLGFQTFGAGNLSDAGGGENGLRNVAIGWQSMYSTTTGYRNTAVGWQALFDNTTGYENTAIGRGALNNNITGNQNTAIGKSALFYTTGSNNIALGYNAGTNLTTGSNNILIGSGIDVPIGTGDNQLNIGDLIHGDLSAGKIGIGTTSPGSRLEVKGTTDDNTAVALNATDSAGTSLLYVRNDGNVGIGTTNPTAKLHITGQAGVDGLRFPDGTIMTSAGTGSANSVTNNTTVSITADDDVDASGDIDIKTGTTTRMFIENDGDVGIGTTTPDWILSVTSDSNTQAIFGQDKTSGVSQISIGEEDADNSAFGIGYDHDNNFGYMQVAGDAVGVGLVVADSGDVGIGTTTPDQNLHIKPNGDAVIHLEESSAGDDGWISRFSDNLHVASNDEIRFGTGGQTDIDVVINSSGNVSIGATAPDRRLSVSDTSNNTQAIFGQDRSSGVSQISIGEQDGADSAFSIGYDHDNNFGYMQVVGDPNGSGLRVMDGGDVGIGTEGTGERMLHIYGSDSTGLDEGGELRLYMADDHDATYNYWRMDVFENDLRFGPTDQAFVTLSGDSAGFVGIGTANPTAKLHIGGENGVDGIRFPDGSLLTSANIGSAGSLANQGTITINADTDDNAFGDISLLTGITSKMFIKNDGDIGIGTISPGSRLEVKGATDDNTAAAFNATDSAGTSILYARNDGNVGIATKAPPQALSVAGNIATGDTTTGDVDVFHYFSTDGSWTGEYLKWDDGAGEFQLSDDLNITGLLTGDSAQFTGDVGIGTASPGSRLEVKGATDDNTAAALNATDSAGTSILYARNDGNVGIGTTSPSELLHLSTSGGNELQYALKLQNPYGATSESATGILFQVATTDGTSEKAGIVFERTSTYGRGKIYFLQNNVADVSSATLADARVTISRSGNIGIKTTSPSCELTISKNGSGTGYIALIDTQATGQTLYINNGWSGAGGAGYAGFYFQDKQIMTFDQSSGDVGIGTASPGSRLEVKGATDDTTAAALNATDSAGTSILYVRNDGNVGIGTTSPGNLLHVKTSADNQRISVQSDTTDGNVGLQLENDSQKWLIQAQGADDDKLYFVDETRAAVRMVIDTSGNVGIGTATPEEELEVNGSVIAKEGFATKLWDVAGGHYEYASDTVEYYSPDQHGGYFGTVYRKYFVVPDGGGAGTEVDIDIGVDPILVLGVWGYLLMFGAGDNMYMLGTGTNTGNGYLSNHVVVYANILRIDPNDSFDIQGGECWIDYTK